MILIYETTTGLGMLEFDATVRELHLGTASATEHEVESGVNITDHVRPELAKLTAEVVVSNTPLQAVGNIRSVQAPVDVTTQSYTHAKDVAVSMRDLSIPLPGAPTIRGQPKVTPGQSVVTVTPGAVQTLQFPVAFDRVKDVSDELTRLRRAGTVLYVSTTLRDYPSMVLTSVSEPRDLQEALTVTLELKEIRVVEAVTVSVDPVPLELRAKKAKPQGAKVTYELDPQKESLALQYGGEAASLFDRTEIPL